MHWQGFLQFCAISMTMPQKSVKYDVLCIAVRQAFAKTSTYRLRCRSVCADTYIHTRMYNLAHTDAPVHTHMYGLACTDSPVQTRRYIPTCTGSHVQTRMFRLACADTCTPVVHRSTTNIGNICIPDAAGLFARCHWFVALAVSALQ